MEMESTLHPVILTVPEDARRRHPRDLVAYLSRRAREALRLSAEKSCLALGEPRKDESGRPLPENGVFWSLTHKPEYVAAVVARQPIGIDVEKIVARQTGGLFEKVAAEEEWALMGGKSWKGFHRYWTAKEAVLKAEGTGLIGLSKCRVIDTPDDLTLIVQIGSHRTTVEHHFFDNHVASVVKTTDKIDWSLMASGDQAV